MRFYPVLLVVCLLTLAGTGAVAPERGEIYFFAEDPEGDDNGPGTYLYPRDPAFAPYEGLFDLLAFKVWSDQGENVYFDMTIKTVTNPWAAPEGFIHPVIHIYVVTGRGEFTGPVNDGPRVIFSPQAPWEFCVTGIGWENSIVYHPAVTGGWQETPIKAVYLPEENVIRLPVAKTITGVPGKNWRYYVLVGSYDGLGPGFFREIKKEADDWFFGGGGEGAPRVLDILAPEKGKYAQEKQMRPSPEGKPACLYPVGPETKVTWWLWLLPLVAAAVFYVVFRRRPRFSFFWYKEKKN